MNMLTTRTLSQALSFPGTVQSQRQGIVVIVSDDETTLETMAPVCDFLDLKVAVVSAAADLENVLRDINPMGVIADLDGEEQDGFHTMKLVARYSRDLPILLLTGGDPVMMGAADAIQDMWGLTAVTQTSEFAIAGQLVAFLFNAGRRAGCMRLVPI